MCISKLQVWQLSSSAAVNKLYANCRIGFWMRSLPGYIVHTSAFWASSASLFWIMRFEGVICRKALKIKSNTRLTRMTLTLNKTMFWDHTNWLSVDCVTQHNGVSSFWGLCLWGLPSQSAVALQMFCFVLHSTVSRGG